jgi:hypothetical protein
MCFETVKKFNIRQTTETDCRSLFDWENYAQCDKIPKVLQNNEVFIELFKKFKFIKEIEINLCINDEMIKAWIKNCISNINNIAMIFEKTEIEPKLIYLKKIRIKWKTYLLTTC